MTEENEEKSLTNPRSDVPTEINLGPRTSIDLAWLPEEERKALLIDYAKGVIDLDKKAKELQIDTSILKRTLDDLSDTTREASESGNAVTISHTQSTKVGRTEVLMGNTERAQSGKLSKSQTGEMNWTPYYIFAIIVAIVIIIAFMSG
jgi:hypothetical protein